MPTGHIQFNCPHCHNPLRVRTTAAGKSVACPNSACRKVILVPQQASGVERSSSGEGPPPTGITPLLLVIFLAWSAGTAIVFVPSVLFRWNLLIALFFFLAWSVLAFGCVIHVLQGKARVLRQKAKQEVDLFFGLVKLVAWNPNEGVVLLRDKAVSHLDDDPYDGGGLKVIYPMLGEELALRVPLERQILEFVDEEVLTREFIPMKIRGMLEWEIVNIEHFFLHTGQEIRGLSDRHIHFDETPMERPKLEVARHVLTLMAEERTRTVVAQAATGLLVAQQIASALPAPVRKELEDEDPIQGKLSAAAGSALSVPSSSADYRSATDGLALQIQQKIIPEVGHYGIVVHRVALQEVKLPPEIYTAAKEACAMSYLPMKAQAKATARSIELLAEGQTEASVRKMKLQAEADVIGADAVATREVVASAPGFTLVDFLNQWFADFAQKRQPRMPARK